MSPPFKIIVVGGGFAGLSAAIALSKKGHEVVVLEATKEFQNSGGILSFYPNAFRILEGYGLYKTLVEECEIEIKVTRLRKYTGEVIAETFGDKIEELYGYRFVDLMLEISHEDRLTREQTY
jgi:salicylate hydroxylase